MKTLEFEIQAENGIVKLPDDLQAYYDAKVRVTIFVDGFRNNIPQQSSDNQSNNEKYSKYIDTTHLDVALEGLLAVATAISKTNKEGEALQTGLQQIEKQALELMRQAKSGEKTLAQSNALVMENLQKEEQIKKQSEAKIKELSELEYIKTQIQEVVSRLKMQHEVEKTVHQKMPDSSETLNTLERMKSKVAENEALGSIYENFKNAKELDPEVEKKINEILDMEAQKRQEALDELKKKIGIL
jgi:chromosome segregation ATPase